MFTPHSAKRLLSVVHSNHQTRVCSLRGAETRLDDLSDKVDDRFSFISAEESPPPPLASSRSDPTTKCGAQLMLSYLARCFVKSPHALSVPIFKDDHIIRVLVCEGHGRAL